MVRMEYDGYRVAVWLGYYQTLPDIIGYCPYTIKIYELAGGKMYGNNSTLYGGTKVPYLSE